MKKAYLMLVPALFASVIAFSQDGKDVNINVNTKGNAWYATPWVWVVGAAVFILLLVALSRSSSRRD